LTAHNRRKVMRPTFPLIGNMGAPHRWEIEMDELTKLLFSQKHLYIAFQETRHLREFPDDNPEEVHGRFVDAANEVYHPLEEALLYGLPIQDALQTVLLAAQTALDEGKVF
jgi:hypothetical protein